MKIDIDIIYGEDLEDYLKDSLKYNGLSWLQDVMENLEIGKPYYNTNDYGVPVVLSDDDINEMFEEYIDEITDNTDFIDNYPEYKEKIKIMK